MSRETREDVLRAVIFLVLGVVLLVVVPDAMVPWRPDLPMPPPAVEIAVLCVACLGITMRRRHPVAGLLVATGALAVGPFVVGVTHTGVLLVFGEMLYNAVLHASRRASRWVAGAAAVVTALLTLRSLIVEDPAAAVRTVLSLGLLLAIPVFWAHEVRQHRERADAERDRVERERRLAELDRAAAVATERNRMARDLHDVIAGQLSAIAIQSEAALSVDADPDTLRCVLADVRRGSVASLAEMRTMIGLLRADDSDEPRTAPAGLDRIDALLDAGRATGLRVALEDRRPGGADVPAAVDLAAYRIVQESLTNAAKHAPGSAVRLVLRHEDGELRVEIDNELVRDAPAGGGTGTGLLGLAERAAAVGGSVQAGPRGRSWTVRAALPTSPVAS